MNAMLSVLTDLTEGFVQTVSSDVLNRQLAARGVEKTEHVVMFRLPPLQEDLYMAALEVGRGLNHTKLNHWPASRKQSVGSNN